MKKFENKNVDKDILELISENDEVITSFVIQGTGAQQVSIVLTMKKLYIAKKNNSNKSMLEIPADEIVLINYRMEVKKSLLMCKSHLIGVLEVVDVKKKILNTIIEDIPLQKFEKPLYRIKRELESITNKNWQIIQSNQEIMVRRSDINERVSCYWAKNINTASMKQLKTGGSDLWKTSGSKATDSWLQTSEEVFSNPTVQKAIIYLILGIIAVMVIIKFAEQILITMMIILLIYAFFKYMQEGGIKTSKRRRR